MHMHMHMSVLSPNTIAELVICSFCTYRETQHRRQQGLCQHVNKIYFSRFAIHVTGNTPKNHTTHWPKFCMADQQRN